MYGGFTYSSVRCQWRQGSLSLQYDSLQRQAMMTCRDQGQWWKSWGWQCSRVDSLVPAWDGLDETVSFFFSPKPYEFGETRDLQRWRV
jgi:hypothetical protein